VKLDCRVAAVLLVMAGILSAPAARAQDYPIRPIRLIVAFTPGGTTDYVARLLADKLKDRLGQSVVVENKPGANGAIGAEYVARAAPDGYTAFFTTVGAVAINPGLYPNLRYDPLKDFAPVGLAVFNSTMLVVNATMQVNSAKELAELARKTPGKIGIAITGIGAISHLGLELFKADAGVDITAVPYRGAAQAITDILGGTVDGLFGDVPTVLGQIRGGKIKALAATSSKRSDIFPDVPTFVEQGFANTVADQWAGIVVPAQTPPAAIEKLNAALVATLGDPEIRAKLAQSGVAPSPGTPSAFGEYLRSETARYTKLVREKGIKGE
jgi:tripartite-type tricarboxylate transporter receptor subunit TctC